MGSKEVEIGELAGAIVCQLFESWAREMAEAAEPVRGLMGVDQPEVSEANQVALARVLSVVFQAVMVGDIHELWQELEGKIPALNAKIQAIAETNCQCPKHRQAVEGAANG